MADTGRYWTYLGGGGLWLASRSTSIDIVKHKHRCILSNHNKSVLEVAHVPFTQQSTTAACCRILFMTQQKYYIYIIYFSISNQVTNTKMRRVWVLKEHYFTLELRIINTTIK